MVVVLLLALAGCASVDVQKPAATATHNEAMQQARALAQEHATLPGAARNANAARIDALLAQLDDATLAREAARLPVGDPLYNFAGRALVARGLPLPRPFDRGDATFGAADRPAADRDGYRPPLKIGVLLPLSGSQAAAATAVRDGLLAGYYGERRRRPELRFHDTATLGTRAAYARAVSEGSDFVIGPLGREEVDALFAGDALPVPLLALNRGGNAPQSGSAGFSLSPEDEGISLAGYLAQRGSKRVLLVAGNEDAQRRAIAAARTQLERRGIQVVASLYYRDDLTEALRQAVLAEGGVDAVLLALKTTQARTLAPQLAAAGLTSTLRVATSQIAAGTGKPADDMVLDGIVHPIDTWSVRGVAGLPQRASAAALVDSAKGPAARLFAFGFDAWLLAGYLQHLATAPNASITGATGRLSLDGFGNVLRQPSWSRFSGGVPVPLGDDGR
ncbi:MAG: penicillin-binding protein activator [Thermomonas sp.]|uniref:penicillin-binding protein activator n=1 Tax=Thermomonas sp. TaxID=1971895 RepID=UPI0039E5D6D9